MLMGFTEPHLVIFCSEFTLFELLDMSISDSKEFCDFA